MSQREIWPVLIAVTALLTGCEDSNDENSPNAIDLGKATLGSCLKNGGAKFAESTGELEFFAEAQREGTANMFGSYFDESAKLFVNLWEDGDDPREWLLWEAQPFDESRTPFEIVESPTSGSYVAYAIDPTVIERNSLEDCTQ